MKILSWNVNGIRAVYRKNFLEWLAKSRADIVCLQEIKAQKDQIPPDLLTPPDYLVYINPARRKGYAGTLIYTKQKPNRIKINLNLKRFDSEGRMLELHYPRFTPLEKVYPVTNKFVTGHADEVGGRKNIDADPIRNKFLNGVRERSSLTGFILINLYLPHGGRQKENLDYKLQVYQCLLRHLKQLKDKKVVLIGDFNIAHQEIDLARPKDNQNNTMFTSPERKQIDKIITLGFTDTFRELHREGGGHYTWWPYFYNARSRNLGWRIDYAFISKPLAPRLKKAFILPKIVGSDHCPIGIEI